MCPLNTVGWEEVRLDVDAGEVQKRALVVVSIFGLRLKREEEPSAFPLLRTSHHFTPPQRTLK